MLKGGRYSELGGFRSWEVANIQCKRRCKSVPKIVYIRYSEVSAAGRGRYERFHCSCHARYYKYFDENKSQATELAVIAKKCFSNQARVNSVDHASALIIVHVAGNINK